MASPAPPNPPKEQPTQPSPAAATIPSQAHDDATSSSQRALLKQPYKNPYLHNVALLVTPISLVALFLPPRRLDLRMGILGGVSVWGVLQLRADWTGHTFRERVSSSPSSSSGKKSGMFSLSDLPTPEAAAMQQRIREEKLRRQNLSPEDRARLEAQRQRRRDERGTLEAIWMGDAGEDWREKRAERERKAMKEGGGGVWGLISDQVGEVFSRGGEKKEGNREREDDGSDAKKSS